MTLRNKIHLAIILIVASALLLVVFVCFPLLKGIKENSEELARQRTNLASFDAKTESLDEFKNVYYDLESNLKTLEDLFVDPEMPVSFISFLEEASKESGADVKISLASSGEEDGWPFISFQLNAKGVFADLMRFIEKVENGSYLAEIQNITISQPEETYLAQANFLLKAYTK